jgi:hypothetical protein
MPYKFADLKELILETLQKLNIQGTVIESFIKITLNHNILEAVSNKEYITAVCVFDKHTNKLICYDTRQILPNVVQNFK